MANEDLSYQTSPENRTQTVLQKQFLKTSALAAILSLTLGGDVLGSSSGGSPTETDPLLGDDSGARTKQVVQVHPGAGAVLHDSGLDDEALDSQADSDAARQAALEQRLQGTREFQLEEIAVDGAIRIRLYGYVPDTDADDSRQNDHPTKVRGPLSALRVKHNEVYDLFQVVDAFIRAKCADEPGTEIELVLGDEADGEHVTVSLGTIQDNFDAVGYHMQLLIMAIANAQMDQLVTQITTESQMAEGKVLARRQLETIQILRTLFGRHVKTAANLDALIASEKAALAQHSASPQRLGAASHQPHTGNIQVGDLEEFNLEAKADSYSPSRASAYDYDLEANQSSQPSKPSFRERFFIPVAIGSAAAGAGLVGLFWALTHFKFI